MQFLMWIKKYLAPWGGGVEGEGGGLVVNNVLKDLLVAYTGHD